MLVELLVEFFLRPIFEFVIFGIFYGSGFLLVSFFSLGKIELAPLSNYGAKGRGKWYQFDRKIWIHRGEHRRQLRAAVTILVGMVFWLAVFMVCFLKARQAEAKSSARDQSRAVLAEKM